MLAKSNARLIWPVLILLSACVNPVAYVPTQTELTICRELGRSLPNYSTDDTAETLRSGAAFIVV